MGDTRHAPTALAPGKRYHAQLWKRLGGTPGRSGSFPKISRSTGIRSPESQARSESLYRRSYPGTQRQVVTRKQWFDPYYSKVVCVIQRQCVCYELAVKLSLLTP